MQPCLFHVLKNFEREITTTKRTITEAEKKRTIAILNDMVYADSEETYEALYREMESLLGFFVGSRQ